MGCVTSTHPDSRAFSQEDNTVDNHKLNQSAVSHENVSKSVADEKQCMDMDISDLSYAEHNGKYTNMDTR